MAYKHYTHTTEAGDVKVFADCQMCDELVEFTVPAAEYSAWQAGACIQTAMPSVAKENREVLISGTCGACFAKLFPQPKPALTTEQLTAIRDFARVHGRNWKSILRTAWMTGDYYGRDDANFLQQIRNTFGPSWLVNFRLAAHA